jgi:hypothetical protein
LSYIINDEADPNNHPIFSFDTDLGYSLFPLTDAPEHPLEIKNSISLCEDSPPTTSVWKMFFDEASSREGDGAKMVFVSPTQETISLSYKLEFETTNNVAEYEALILGLRAAKDMGIKEIFMFGDIELIVQQIMSVYQANHPRLRSYRNEVWDLVNIFFLSFNISFFPKGENGMADSLEFSASNFSLPLPPKLRYDVEENTGPLYLTMSRIGKCSRMILRLKYSWRLMMSLQPCILIKFLTLKSILMLIFF